MLIMIHAGHTDFTACIHAVMLPIPNLVIIQVFVVSHHCLFFTPFAIILEIQLTNPLCFVSHPHHLCNYYTKTFNKSFAIVLVTLWCL